MGNKRYIVNAVLSNGESYEWSRDSLNEAKSLAKHIGLEGFFAGDELNHIKGVAYISPHQIQQLRAALAPEYVCDKCKNAERTEKHRYCAACIKSLRSAMRKTGYLELNPRPSVPRQATHKRKKTAKLENLIDAAQDAPAEDM